MLKAMEVHSEVGLGLKASLLVFALVLVGTLVYFIIQQNEELGLIYATQDIDEIISRRDATPKTVDSTIPAP